MLKKGLAVAVILLFIGMCVVPLTGTVNKIENIYLLNRTYNQIGEHRYSSQVVDRSDNVIVLGTYMFIMGENEPPYAPIISGISRGEVGIEHKYFFDASDPDGDYIYYYIDWGDGDFVDWYGPCESGVIIGLGHTWVDAGTYTISSRAKDSWGAIGEWGTTEVTMPVNQHSYSFPLLQRILERFPNMFPLLRSFIYHIRL